MSALCLVQMLETVGLGIAMGNAKEIVKQHAKYVTDSVNEDGIAKAIKKWLMVND